MAILYHVIAQLQVCVFNQTLVVQMLDCVILSCHPFCHPADNSLSSVGISATEYY